MRSKFHVELARVIRRLREQHECYRALPEETRAEMRRRALTVAYSTAHTESRVAAQNLERQFMIYSARVAIERRTPVAPEQWDKRQGKGRTALRWNEFPAKARFARALAGVTLGASAVCLDVHMLRLPARQRPRSAVEQWRRWFRVYRETYGEERALWCLDWHFRCLDWIAGFPGVRIGE
jgi:hypothetical protein